MGLLEKEKKLALQRKFDTIGNAEYGKATFTEVYVTDPKSDLLTLIIYCHLQQHTLFRCSRGARVFSNRYHVDVVLAALLEVSTTLRKFEAKLCARILGSQVGCFSCGMT